MNFAAQFLAAMEGKATPLPVAEDETDANVAEGIARNTKDFVLRQLAKEPKEHPLADFVAHLPETMGYRTRASPSGPDRRMPRDGNDERLGPRAKERD